MQDVMLPAGVQREIRDELGLLVIDTPRCRARIAWQGAQLLDFAGADGAPLLWCSPQALYRRGKAIRGGIPLCFPWFGPHPRDAAKPAHGFARTRDWQLAEASALPDGARQLVFVLSDDEATRALWPASFTARLAMTLGERIALELAVTNTGTAAVTPEIAFHAYFSVADVRAALVTGLAGAQVIDQLQPDAPRTHSADELHFAGETDRILLGAGQDYRLHDEAGGRRLRITSTGCPDVVVWNPWVDKTARLADMPVDGWQHMVCIECASLRDDARAIAPGATARYALVIGAG